MAKYQQYAEYKDSGVEWLGEIPSEWDLLRGKWRFKSLKEVNRNLQCMERLALTMRGVIERSIDSDDGLQPLKFSGYQIFEKNDLVFKLIDLENYKTSRVGLVFKKGIMSPAYIRLQPFSSVYPKFFYYLYFDLYLRGIYNEIGGQGVRSALNASDLLELEVCVPNITEQNKIASFLDYEIGKINTLIEKQQSLIQLLKEKRQAVISHAVTKGLNPDAPMKDSGVEWLGEVPEHWEVMPLKYAVTFQRGHDLPAQNRTAGDIPLVTSAGISSTHNIAIAKAPGLVTGRYGTIGKFNLLEEDYWPLNTTLYSINLRSNNPKYLWYMLHNLTPIFLANSLKSAVPGVDRNDLHVVKVAMPKNLDEQEALCDYLEKTHSKYDLVIEKASESLVLLQERRTALISAAVTGKIDVRGWQAPITDN